MRRVLLAVHAAREEAAKIAVSFAAELQTHGIEVCVLDSDAGALRAAGLQDSLVVEAGSGAAAGCELAVVFGGDGTILRAAEMCRGTETAVLGVNLGHVGFLAEADVEDLKDVVHGVVTRSYTVEERLTVDVSVSVAGEVVATNWALNEASVEKAARERMLEIVLEIDDRPVSRWGCDGIVCATPTGSTAYNFSAGGPIVWPEVAALLMVPISAHALFARPLVVSPSSTLAIEVVGEQSTGVLWCDGRRAAELPLGARVEVRKGRENVRLARLHPASFADRLVRKFDLPVAGWRGAAERRQEEQDS
ncbi:NAD kinase [Aeromicrobium chenweiae]|uniref:NAD kinase n=1 Tax=Aeromicrobium chenweiae TaxID=2079793 RepID=A0A2S0WMF3_9ACTN|nr:NAD kinase [Aeromicrobium chenweiae]AWB92491.1 NAD kinase [Aeromicrobium chenweiae]TGN31218.1 NAD kinase [Aeromicrobium chenweiae]